VWNCLDRSQSHRDTVGNQVALCILCPRLHEAEKDCLVFLSKSINSSGIKNFESAAA